MIKVDKLSVSYGPIVALQDVSLGVDAGEFLLVTGPSGCGKSTLAHVLMGLVPDPIPAQLEGSVRIAGLDPQAPCDEPLSKVVGCVFQNPSTQLFHLCVEEEIAFGPRNLGLVEQEVHQRVEWALEAVGLKELRTLKPRELSRGQQQCVAIAGALAMQPCVLILDEPTASLDVPGTQMVMSALRQLQHDLGMTIVMIEHRLAGVLSLIDKVALMEEGKIVAVGTKQQVLSDEAMRMRLGLRRPTKTPITPWSDLITANGNRAEAHEPLLSFGHVSAGYERRPVLHDVSFDLYPGEFVALVGNNGAGKSTLGLVAAGLMKPSAGKVIYQGGRRPHPGLDVALLFQDPTTQLFTDSVGDEVAFGPLNYDCFDTLRHKTTLQIADLSALVERNPSSLSVGQQQRTALAACVATHPRLLILDEPTLGQDWGHLECLMNYLQTLNKQGVTILLISHDYKLVHRYAKRILLMEAGRITRHGYLKNGTRG